MFNASQGVCDWYAAQISAEKYSVWANNAKFANSKGENVSPVTMNEAIWLSVEHTLVNSVPSQTQAELMWSFRITELFPLVKAGQLAYFSTLIVWTFTVASYLLSIAFCSGLFHTQTTNRTPEDLWQSRSTKKEWQLGQRNETKIMYCSLLFRTCHQCVIVTQEAAPKQCKLFKIWNINTLMHMCGHKCTHTVLQFDFSGTHNSSGENPGTPGLSILER